MPGVTVKHIAAYAAGALLLAFALRAGLGARWFSFYGVATVALAALVPVTAFALERLKSAGRRRWPVLVLAVTTALAAFAQIGFWLAFFHGGDLGFMLGVARSMARTYIDAALPWLALAMAGSWVALLVSLTRASGGTTKAPGSDGT